MLCFLFSNRLTNFGSSDNESEDEGCNKTCCTDLIYGRDFLIDDREGELAEKEFASKLNTPYKTFLY